MGNQNCSIDNQNKRKHSKLVTLQKLKQKKFDDAKCDTDYFIIKYNKNNKENNNNVINIESLHQRRIIFISLLCLYQTWKLCPAISLYSSIFILPLKRQWIYNPELQTNVFSQLSTICSDIRSRDKAETEEFIELLKWKDAQGLVFWMKNDYKVSDVDSLVHPFWHYLNTKLSQLYDPITRNKYNPISLDETWWQKINKANMCSKSSSTYYVKTSRLLNELFFLTMKFKTIKQILCTSNPNSFCVLKSYNDVNNNYYNNNNNNNIDIFDEFGDDEDKNDWWISSDYDPYDVDLENKLFF